MRWLRTRIKGRKRRRGRTAGEQPERPHQTASPHLRLILLVHDASGPASYRLHTFADAQSGEEFIQSWFPMGFQHGILAFWAGHGEPARPADQEVVILVRDEVRHDIVCPFSLPDMELARAWIAKEARRGLDLGLVLLYWAVPVRVHRDDWGRVRLAPREPPSSGGPAAELAPMSEEGARRLLHAIETLDESAERDEPGETPASGTEGPTIDEVLDEINFAALAEEFDRLIRKKRWEQREGPFQGFGSPPGKF